VFLEGEGVSLPAGCHITSRVNTVQGVSCRMVAQELPEFAQAAEPSLEDAYMYLIETRGAESA